MSARLAWPAIAFAFALAGCAETEIGQRYRGERDLFWADRDYGALYQRFGRVVGDEWSALADRYETIAREHLTLTADPTRPSTLQIRELAAQALFRATQIRSALHDSLWVERVFVEMAESFASAPGMAGEIWLARGRAAEQRGDWREAIRCFEILVRDVEPAPDRPGVAGAVLDLPLRIALARARLGSPDSTRAAFDAALRTYRELAEPDQPAALRAQALLRLARTRGAEDAWDDAVRILDDLAAWSNQSSPRRPIPVVEVDLEALRAARRAEVPLDALVARANSLVARHAPGETTLQACIDLAQWLLEDGRLADALTWVDRGLADSPETTVRADALLLRAQIFDRLDRPVEAYQAYRLVQLEYSISEAALRSHVDLARHFARLGDRQARIEALERAERELRAFIDRYPRGSHTVLAFENLVEVLEMKGDHQAAVDELLRLSEDVRGTSREAAVLVRAARKCETDLQSPERAATILLRVAERFPATRIGAWAAAETDRLGGAH